MARTTIKLSTSTRDRLRALGGETHADTAVEALDLLEEQRFWAHAEAAAAWRASLSPQNRARRERAEADIDDAFDGIG